MRRFGHMCHNTLQHTAPRCNTLQRTAAHCSTLFLPRDCLRRVACMYVATYCNIQQHAVTRFNARQRTAMHGNAWQHTFVNTRAPEMFCMYMLHDAATPCNILQHPFLTTRAPRRLAYMCHNTLQHTATHCNAFSLPRGRQRCLGHRATGFYSQSPCNHCSKR